MGAQLMKLPVKLMTAMRILTMQMSRKIHEELKDSQANFYMLRMFLKATQ